MLEVDGPDVVEDLVFRLSSNESLGEASTSCVQLASSMRCWRLKSSNSALRRYCLNGDIFGGSSFSMSMDFFRGVLRGESSGDPRGETLPGNSPLPRLITLSSTETRFLGGVRWPYVYEVFRGAGTDGMMESMVLETSAISESAPAAAPKSMSRDFLFGCSTLSSLAFPMTEFGSSCSRNMLNRAERFGIMRL